MQTLGAYFGVKTEWWDWVTSVIWACKKLVSWVSFALRCQVLAACRRVKAHLDVCANVIVEQQVQMRTVWAERRTLFTFQPLKTITKNIPKSSKHLMRRPTIHDLTSKERHSNISTFEWRHCIEQTSRYPSIRRTFDGVVWKFNKQAATHSLWRHAPSFELESDQTFTNDFELKQRTRTLSYPAN